MNEVSDYVVKGLHCPVGQQSKHETSLVGLCVHGLSFNNHKDPLRLFLPRCESPFVILIGEHVCLIELDRGSFTKLHVVSLPMLEVSDEFVQEMLAVDASLGVQALVEQLSGVESPCAVKDVKSVLTKRSLRNIVSKEEALHLLLKPTSLPFPVFVAVSSLALKSLSSPSCLRHSHWSLEVVASYAVALWGRKQLESAKDVFEPFDF